MAHAEVHRVEQHGGRLTQHAEDEPEHVVARLIVGEVALLLHSKGAHRRSEAGHTRSYV